MWEFKKNNTFCAVAFTSYGTFWISFFYYIKYVAATLPPADAHTATGIFLLTWTIFTAYLTIASIKTNAVLTTVFATLLGAFVLLTLGAFNVNESLTHAGGYIGLGVAFLAFYASAAGVTNATLGRQVLPLFPAKKSRPGTRAGPPVGEWPGPASSPQSTNRPIPACHSRPEAVR